AAESSEKVVAAAELPESAAAYTELLVWPNTKGSSLALSISKMKAASYPDFGLELLVPEQMWIDDVCTYDISAKYDFKNLHPSDFEDLNMLLQGHPDHLPGSDKRILSTTVKLWTRNLVIRQGVEDFQLVVFSVNNNERKIMRFNKIYKFSGGTLTRILEALAYRVKEFKIKRLNPVGFNLLVHSFRALSALRCFGLRMDSTTTKPCQGDYSEVYLITGSIYTDQGGTVVLATLFNESEQRHLRLVITNLYLQESRWLQLLAKNASIHNPMLTLHISNQRQHYG
nr:hypothetical protein [Tanacetum cinerariifolium]